MLGCRRPRPCGPLIGPLLLLWACSVRVGVAATSAGCGGEAVAVATDGRAARLAQERHLWVLFEKYGDGNGSLTLQGLQLMLRHVGLGRLRTSSGAHTHTHTHGHVHTHAHDKGQPNTPTPTHSHSHTDPPKHSHTHTHTHPVRSRRSAEYDLTQDHTPSAQNTPPTTQHDDHDQQPLGNSSQQCLSASSLLKDHGIGSGGISVSDFGFLCPALLSQIDSQSCLRHDECVSSHEDHPKSTKGASGHEDHPKNTNIAAAWLGGFLSICIISTLALVGVVLLPLINKTSFNFLLSFLVALAVGTLSGDAFLHLIPHAQGHHKHQHSANESWEEGSHGDGEDSLRSVWTGLTALGGVYFMFLIEHFLTLGKMYKDKKHKGQKKFDQSDDMLETEKLPTIEENDVKALDEAEPNGGSASVRGLCEEEEEMLSHTHTHAHAHTNSDLRDADQSLDCQDKCHSHFHDTVAPPAQLHHHHHDYHHILHHHHSQNHHPHTHTHRHTHGYSRQQLQEAGIATLAWMVIMGDGLHNFSDGLAIGAAFTEGLSSGLSTSVAVFCHELPHELGDFAVLLKAGMTVKQAVLYNALSALMAFFGMATGILIGHYAEHVATWVFALTAGLFLYVALVDMVPEMLHNDASEQGFSHYGYFLLQNAGILLGFGIMLAIAILEPHIQLHFDL
ncbi:zinc transporter ZIP6 isoform X1 [Alosa sapidissima]|uniref:zinc transporter ZIP6 isoform X1 n=1 Tax=Alosa sapidissima TaxID=34773 RepID=UPI001C0888A1|nr:zinc transporter ZIP6 isoform X1 [Alosa sapidissima]XP_041927303.1 zinc transporter ZIP6 isoform X1 [Alosa sapidissima]